MSGSVGGAIPIVLTTAGRTNTLPATLNAQLLTNAQANAPGITQNLPGSLIEDLGSTGTGALVVMDQAVTETINSLTPYGANAFILNQLGQIYGVQLGIDTNTGVYVVFSGVANYPISQGFTVSDGIYQYQIQDGGIIGTGGTSQPMFALATQSGSWAIPRNTVTQIVTSVPSVILNATPPLTVTNPLAGTPSPGPQTQEDYRSQVLQAGLVTCRGTPAFLKTLLGNVIGVNQQLISVRSNSGGWEVIVGGSGDPYQIGYAIWLSIGNPNLLVGSTNLVTNITNANPAVVTTSLTHNYVTGQVAQINGATGISGVNGNNFSATVISPTSFSININTTTNGTYTGNGILTPNFRNVTTSVYNYPDTYTIPFVIPPVQIVTMAVTWNTSATTLVSATAVAAAAIPALVIYVNSLPIGAPMNLFELQATFQTATAGLVPTQLLTRMVFSVSISGVGVAPTSGTGIIAGDPESYFTIIPTAITVTQG